MEVLKSKVGYEPYDPCWKLTLKLKTLAHCIVIVILTNLAFFSEKCKHEIIIIICFFNIIIAPIFPNPIVLAL